MKVHTKLLVKITFHKISINYTYHKKLNKKYMDVKYYTNYIVIYESELNQLFYQYSDFFRTKIRNFEFHMPTKMQAPISSLSKTSKIG